MKYIGIFKAETVFGKRIRSGGAALVDATKSEPHIVALAEERVTGEKYAGGYSQALAAICQSEELAIDEVTAIGSSTCCEPIENSIVGLPDDLGFTRGKLVPVGHHESHATMAFLGSGFDEALVVVSDGGGNVLDHHTGDEWWGHPREQLSYYVGNRRTGLALLDCDFTEPYEVGFGEFYRAVSYFLGWPGSRHASKVMALAAYGSRPSTWPSAFGSESGRLTSILKNEPQAPIDMIIDLGLRLGVDLGEPRAPGAEILEVHRNLAAYTQAQLEVEQTKRIRGLLRATGLKRVCLSGGIALNVVANGVIQEALKVPVYVASAPGDDGQALGNALSLWWKEARADCKSLPLKSFRLTSTSSASLGPTRKIDSAAVSAALGDSGHPDYTVFEYSSSAPVVAKALSRGATVCVFQERSEYGPRALGSRSILGDPRAEDGRALFNQLKNRDWFMPFAPAARFEDDEVASIWFSAPVASPFMSFAIKFSEDRRDLIRAVVSNDGTGRVQSIAREDPSFIAEVVREFENITAVPMVLNTSFNRGGRPIAETIDDALSTFVSLPINILALGRFLVVKLLSPDLIEADVMPSAFVVEGYIVKNGSRKALGLLNLNSRECIRVVQQSTGTVVFVRSEIPLFGPYLEWLREGRKVTTIRYRKGAVELPKMSELPLYETEDYGVGDRTTPTATVRIKSFRYQIFGELTESDAIRDGFQSLGHMREDLAKIYPKLSDNEWVTIYDIGLVE